jgi:hypothetical protein
MVEPVAVVAQLRFERLDALEGFGLLLGHQFLLRQLVVVVERAVE